VKSVVDDMLKSFAAVLRACVVAILRLDATHTRQIEPVRVTKYISEATTGRSLGSGQVIILGLIAGESSSFFGG
jgi:hypothetical protein